MVISAPNEIEPLFWTQRLRVSHHRSWKNLDKVIRIRNGSWNRRPTGSHSSFLRHVLEALGWEQPCVLTKAICFTHKKAYWMKAVNDLKIISYVSVQLHILKPLLGRFISFRNPWSKSSESSLRIFTRRTHRSRGLVSCLSGRVCGS